MMYGMCSSGAVNTLCQFCVEILMYNVSLTDAYEIMPVIWYLLISIA